MNRNEKIAYLEAYCRNNHCDKCPLEGGPCSETLFEDMTDSQLDTCLLYITNFYADELAKAWKAIGKISMVEDQLANLVKALEGQDEKPVAPDNVNHPQHYELPGGLECFDVIVATQGVEAAKHFCLCNAMKYLFRSQRKNGAEDIEKARWYLNKHHDLVEGEGDSNDD